MPLLFLFGTSCFYGFASEMSISDKSYVKEYFDNGQLKAEGWSQLDRKTDFWIFYHSNGQVASKGNFRNNKKEGYWYFYDTDGAIVKEGHYHKNSAEQWWIFYDIAAQTTSKFQYQNNEKNGFALRYKKEKLTKAEKYQDNRKVGEWTSYFAFRRDNPNVSLR